MGEVDSLSLPEYFIEQKPELLVVHGDLLTHMCDVLDALGHPATPTQTVQQVALLYWSTGLSRPPII